MKTMLIALVLAAAGAADERSDTHGAPDAAPMTKPGAVVYGEVCVACHEGQAKKAPHRMFFEMMSAEAIYKALSGGVMKEHAIQADLDDAELRAVAEFLAKEPLSTEPPAPPAPSCDAGSSAFDWADHPVAHPWGINHQNQRRIPDERAGIAREAFADLQVAWAMRFPDAIRARSQPSPAGGAIHVGSHDGTVYALDRATGCIRWTFQASAEVRNAIGITDWAGDEAPQVNPIAYFGDIIGNVYAIDAVTGEPHWTMKADPHPNVTITGSPVHFEGRIFVPVSSLEVSIAGDPDYSCCSFRGSLLALDARSGEPIWKSYTIPGEPEPTYANRAGTMQQGPSGAPIWNSPTIDAKRRQLYVGTGENYSSPADGNSDAIIAFDLDTGERVWTYQATAGDAWNIACMVGDDMNCPKENGPDVDFGAGTLMATTPSGRELVLGGQKSGVVHALDPETGELVWKTRVGRGGIQGGIHFGMAADDERVYVPISDFPDGQEHPLPDRPGLFALELETGQEVWAHPAPDRCNGREFCAPGISAAITVAGGTVIAGHMDGWLRVYDVDDGSLVWELDTTGTFDTLDGVATHGGSFGGPGPMVVDGRIFVNSGYGIYFHMPGNLFLTLEPGTRQ